MGRARQDRPHPYAGCDAADAGAGILRLRAAGRGRDRTDRGRAAGALRAGAGRYRGREPASTRPRALPRAWRRRSPRQPACRSSRRRTSSRRSPRETRCCSPTARWQRVAAALNKIACDIRLLGSGPRCGPRRAGAAGQRAGLLDHARQGQPDAGRGLDAGLRAGVRQPEHDAVRRQPGAVRAQHLSPGDGLHFPAIGRAAGRCGRELHRAPAGRAGAA